MARKDPVESLINELCAEYREHDARAMRAELTRRAASESEERARAEAYVRAEREARRARAVAWEGSLDPRTTLGRWFDEFARVYPSRVAAAEVYLQSLDEADRVR